MKKLITTTFTFAFALLFTAGIAFGQVNHTLDVTQDGDLNTYNLNLNNNANFEKVDIYQNGISNNATTNISSGTNSTLLISQIGNNSNGEISINTNSGQPHWLKIKQVGNKDQASLTVSGGVLNKVAARIIQVGGNLNKARVILDGHGNAGVIQNGRRNYASIRNAAGAFDIKVYQDGINNTLGKPGVATNYVHISHLSSFDVHQIGNNNTIDKFAINGGGSVDLRQVGNQNYINTGGFYHHLMLNVTQTGFHNVANIDISN